ncbi:MAG TPA: hypothetical protein VHE83_18605 [Mycobacteriales bacterium]|nr:hypothetical protein [Mycobacteriales bacterium]
MNVRSTRAGAALAATALSVSTVVSAAATATAATKPKPVKPVPVVKTADGDAQLNNSDAGRYATQSGPDGPVLVPDGWTATGGAGVANPGAGDAGTVRDDTATYGASGAPWFIGGTAASSDLSQAVDLVNPTFVRTYRLSAHLGETKPGSTDAASVSLQWLRNGGAYGTALTVAAPTATEVDNTAPGKTPKDGAAFVLRGLTGLVPTGADGARVTVMFTNGSPGAASHAVADDVQLWVASLPTTCNTPNLLRNAGAESLTPGGIPQGWTPRPAAGQANVVPSHFAAGSYGTTSLRPTDAQSAAQSSVLPSIDDVVAPDHGQHFFQVTNPNERGLLSTVVDLRGKAAPIRKGRGRFVMGGVIGGTGQYYVYGAVRIEFLDAKKHVLRSIETTPLYADDREAMTGGWERLVSGPVAKQASFARVSFLVRNGGPNTAGWADDLTLRYCTA